MIEVHWIIALVIVTLAAASGLWNLVLLGRIRRCKEHLGHMGFTDRPETALLNIRRARWILGGFSVDGVAKNVKPEATIRGALDRIHALEATTTTKKVAKMKSLELIGVSFSLQRPFMFGASKSKLDDTQVRMRWVRLGFVQICVFYRTFRQEGSDNGQ